MGIPSEAGVLRWDGDTPRGWGAVFGWALPCRLGCHRGMGTPSRDGCCCWMGLPLKAGVLPQDGDPIGCWDDAKGWGHPCRLGYCHRWGHTQMMFPWVFPRDKDPLGGQGAAAGWGPQLTCTREHATAWEGSRDASTCRMRKAAVSPQPEPFPNHHQPLLGHAPTWYFGGLPCCADPRLYPSWGHYSTCRWQRALRTHSALPRARGAGTGRFLPAETPRPPGTPTPPTPPRPAPGNIGKKDENRVRCHLWAAGGWRGAKGRDGPTGHPKEHWRCVPQV